MKKNIILSIIVPIYNGEQYLDSLVSVVKQQEFQLFELILVNDGSTDSTYQKCEYYAQKYGWIYVIHTENGGVSHARNTGLEAAKGEWIQFFDVDDRIHTDMFWDFYKAVEDIKAELVICSCTRKHQGTENEVLCGPKENENLEKREWKSLFCNMPMETRYWLLDYVWNKWYRKDIIERHEIRFDETLSLGEDFVFNTRYFKHIENIVLLKNAYYEYIVDESGLANRFSSEPWVGRTNLYDAQKRLYFSLGLWDYQKDNIQIQAGQIAFGDIRTLNRKNCFYTDKEKIQFIQKMIKSEQFCFLLKYLKSRQGIVFRIYYNVFSTKNAQWIAMLIKLEKLIGRMKK